MASDAEHTAWTVNREERVLGLEVILLKRTYVFPWSQFLHAEGSADEVRAIFTTHDVLVKGAGLDALLSDLAAQQVTVLREPARTEKFTAASGPRITELMVRKEGLEE